MIKILMEGGQQCSTMIKIIQKKSTMITMIKILMEGGQQDWEGEEVPVPRPRHPGHHSSEDFYDSHDALAFGRPGCGAPAR